jgi:hypothetical protein
METSVDSIAVKNVAAELAQHLVVQPPARPLATQSDAELARQFLASIHAGDNLQCALLAMVVSHHSLQSRTLRDALKTHIRLEVADSLHRLARLWDYNQDHPEYCARRILENWAATYSRGECEH